MNPKQNNSRLFRSFRMNEIRQMLLWLTVLHKKLFYIFLNLACWICCFEGFSSSEYLWVNNSLSDRNNFWKRKANNDKFAHCISNYWLFKTRLKRFDESLPSSAGFSTKWNFLFLIHTQNKKLHGRSFFKQITLV